MHSRPMFPIPETQVGDGWVGDVDYTKQATKQDSNFLVDWVRVYQSEGQPVTRFDDLYGAESGAYRIAPASRTEGLTAVSNGDAAWQNKNNFYYGGQPRYETSRSHAVPLMQGRFALRLRAHKHSAESGRMLLPAASDPLQVRLCRRIGEIARRRDDVAVAVHNGAMPEIRNDTPAEPVGECAVPRVRALLSAWWEANARDLPWRFGRATPWGVLVSEVMSQQTQMSRVVPYWTDWMRVWPDVTALAGASTAEIITAWGRLGYPRRALRLQECARVVFEQYHGRLPQTYDELTALPGIGDYTASAVLSFAFGVRIAVVDTNIRRVLSRVFLGVESRGGAASPAERALAGRVLPQDDETDVRDAIEAANARETVNAPESAIREMPQRSTRPSVIWNQSVMELGALVCTAKNPLCDQCPIGEHCAFLAAGRPGLGERRTRPRQRFQGTDRQVRGIILDALRAEPILARERLESLWLDHVQLDKCIASLDDDGLVDMLPDGSLRLPQ